MNPNSKRRKPFTNSKQILLILVLTFFTVSLTGATHIVVSTLDLPVHNINTGKNYATIQEAINDPETLDGHTILVDPGMHNENVIVNKSVRLHGANPSTTIIDGNGAEKVVSLTVNGAEIAGFTVQNGSRGINLDSIQNANVTENHALNCSYGIFVGSCSRCLILNNTTTSTNQAGIYLWESIENSIINNTIANTSHGMWLLSISTNNIISSNFVTNSPQGIVASINCNSNIIIGNTATSSSLGGIVMGGAYNNTIYHNNIEQAWSYGGSINFWDDGTEGNFWKGYPEPDLDEDGIGDTPYTIDESNTDNYPLMGAFNDFNVAWEEESHYVYVISNSTISAFDFKVTYEPEERKAISFNVTGEDGTVGFCRVMFPRVLVTYPYTVLVNYEKANTTELDISNSTHAYLYFTYETTTKYVRIVPEIPSSVILPLFMIFAVFAAVSSKRKIRLSPFHNVYIRDWKRNLYTHTKQKLIEKGVK